MNPVPTPPAMMIKLATTTTATTIPAITSGPMVGLMSANKDRDIFQLAHTAVFGMNYHTSGQNSDQSTDTTIQPRDRAQLLTEMIETYLVLHQKLEI